MVGLDTDAFCKIKKQNDAFQNYFLIWKVVLWCTEWKQNYPRAS